VSSTSAATAVTGTERLRRTLPVPRACHAGRRPAPPPYAAGVSPSGTVLSLHRWPVKSMGGEPAGALELFEHGVVGDRERALYWRGGRRLTARAAPRMLAWSATTDGEHGAGPLVTAPDGTRWRWEDAGLEAAIAEDLGKEVRLVRDPALMQDLEDSVLVTLEPTLRGLGDELGTQLDLRRFRPNVHVAMDAEPFAEAAWEGRQLRIGEAELELLWPCARCAIVTRDPDTQEAWGGLLRHVHRAHDSIFGINARPLDRATIRVGDPVEVL